MSFYCVDTQPTIPVAASISAASQEIQQELSQLKSDHSQLQVKHKEVSIMHICISEYKKIVRIIREDVIKDFMSRYSMRVDL